MPKSQAADVSGAGAPEIIQILQDFQRVEPLGLQEGRPACAPLILHSKRHYPGPGHRPCGWLLGNAYRSPRPATAGKSLMRIMNAGPHGGVASATTAETRRRADGRQHRPTSRTAKQRACRSPCCPGSRCAPIIPRSARPLLAAYPEVAHAPVRLRLLSLPTSGDSWVLPPSKPVIGKDGQVKKDTGGKAIFVRHARVRRSGHAGRLQQGRHRCAQSIHDSTWREGGQ